MTQDTLPSPDVKPETFDRALTRYQIFRSDDLTTFTMVGTVDATSSEQARARWRRDHPGAGPILAASSENNFKPVLYKDVVTTTTEREDVKPVPAVPPASDPDTRMASAGASSTRADL